MLIVSGCVYIIAKNVRGRNGSIRRDISSNPTFSTNSEILLNCSNEKKGTNLGGGFKHFLFSPLFGEDSHFD